MLKNISWTFYWSVIGLLLFIYYGILLFRIYGQKIVQRFGGNPIVRSEPPVQESAKEESSSVAEELVAYFEQASHGKPIKQEILFAMQKIISKSKRKIEGSEKGAIEGLIQLECQEKCAINLSEEELGFVWLA